MAFCNKCGAQLPEGASFCTACGATVDAQQPNPQPNQQQYQQPNFGAPVPTKAPITKREPILAIVLTIVTCGIYGLYWYFCIINDLNTASGDTTDPGAGMVLLLSIITCGIYGWIWLYKAGEKVDKLRVANGEAPSNSALLYLLLSFFGLGIVVYYLIQSELNKVAAD